MRDNMRFETNGLSGLKLLGPGSHSGTSKVYFRALLIVMVLAFFAAGCNGTNDKLGGGSTGPAVNSTVPADGASGVAVDTTITATFSTAMDSATITETTFTVETGGSSISGTVALSTNGLTATFTPDFELTPDTQYTATITNGAKDVNGNAVAEKVWKFITGTGSAPTVLSTDPAAGAIDVPTNAVITATFSTDMNAATITPTTFTLATGATPVSGTVAYNSTTRVATFTPTGGVLAAGTTFTATITTGVKDSNGNAMAEDKIWPFTTGL